MKMTASTRRWCRATIRPPGFKKRPNTAGAQPMGGLPIEEFLAVMNGGDSGDLVGKLMQLGISLASNAG